MRNLIIALAVLLVLTCCNFFKEVKKSNEGTNTSGSNDNSPPIESPPTEEATNPSISESPCKSPPIQEADNCDPTKLADCDLGGIKRSTTPTMGALEAEGC